jgi:hypothetical protein
VKWDKTRNERIQTELAKKQVQHEKEMTSLEKRLKGGYIELSKKREEITSQMNRRYANNLKHA